MGVDCDDILLDDLRIKRANTFVFAFIFFLMYIYYIVYKRYLQKARISQDKKAYIKLISGKSD